MEIYFVLFLLLLIYTFVEIQAKKGINLAHKITIVLILAMLSGFRYEVGNDFNNYVLIYDNIEMFSYLELGFKGLIRLVKFMGGNEQAMFMLSSIVTIVPLAFLINKVCPRYFCVAITVYVLTYIYFEGMNTVRQAISMTIMFYAFYDYLTNKKTWRYVAVVLLAVLFHYSVILVAIAGWLIMCFSGKKIHTIAFAVALMVSFVLGYYLTSFTDQIVSFANLLGQGNSKYLDSIEQRGVNSGTFHYVLNIYGIAFLIFAYYKRMYLSEFENGVLKLFMTAIITYNLFFNFYIGLRFYWYFYLLITLVIPIVLSHIKKKYRPLTFVVIISVFIAYTYLSLGTIYYSSYKYTFDLLAK